MLFTSTMPTHAEKNGGRRVSFPLKRANIAVFGLCDRAAGQFATVVSQGLLPASRGIASFARAGSRTCPPVYNPHTGAFQLRLAVTREGRFACGVFAISAFQRHSTHLPRH
jgi:hypothetical protein